MPIEGMLSFEKFAKFEVFHAKIAGILIIFEHVHVYIKVFDDWVLRSTIVDFFLVFIEPFDVLKYLIAVFPASEVKKR